MIGNFFFISAYIAWWRVPRQKDCIIHLMCISNKNLNLSRLWTPSAINFKDQEWLFPKNVLWPEKNKMF